MEEGRMAVRMGIDTGGTFTDLIGIDEATNHLVIAKTPSTPRRPAQAVMNAIESCGVPADTISALSIGTTVAANALLQRRGANVIYVTTRGFEDIPYIQRMNRKYHFSLKWRKPKPLVERRNCLGIVERLDFHGHVLIPLEESALQELAQQIEARLPDYPAGSVAIAVCLLFSYVNADHELRVRAFLRERFPTIPVSLSHEVAPIWREYERGSTVIADSYVKPVIQDYVSSTRQELAAKRLHMPWALMKSNGGRTTPDLAEAEPIQLLLSGLAGGLIAGHFFGQLVGLDNLVTLDMGGTSCDVGLIRGGRIGYSTNFEIEFGLPVATPTIDLTTIGAGGGSIAWIDKGGLLRVGPQSAGAEPGPVCYDAGGAEVTVTDANLVLGRLDPDYFLGGKIALNVAKAGEAVARLGERLGLDRYAAAQAVLDIANENMANAIRVLSIDRGLDPREFALVAFGGAGPLHACDIAAKVGMTQVVVPIYPGLASAFGALIAAPKVNKLWSKHFRSDSTDAATVDEHFEDLVATVIAELRAEGYSGAAQVARSISMRYWGQNYEQDVPVPEGKVTPALLQQTLTAFHRLHEQFYGYVIGGETIELIRFNVEATGELAPPSLPSLPEDGRAGGRQVTRPVFFQGHGLIDCPIVQRQDLHAGCRSEGPMVIEEIVSTTLVHPAQRVAVDPVGVIRIDLSSGR
jgi:N-methylhydantoinase A